LITLEEIRRVMNEGTSPGVVAHDVMITDFPRVSPGADLAEALRTLANVDLEEIPVWDEERNSLVGLLSRKRITRLYVERMSALRAPK
jgi:CBS domain-containing protein